MDHMEPIVLMYLAYVALSVGLTIWVAHTLSRSGRVFLVDVFRGNEELADSVNHLLVVGFYLINLGYVSLALKVAQEIDDLGLHRHVERGGRFVEHHKTRFKDHGPGDGDTLALTTREFMGIAMAALGIEAHFSQGVDDQFR